MMKRSPIPTVAVAAYLAGQVFVAPLASAATPCDALTSTALGDARLVTSEVVGAGTLSIPGARAAAQASLRRLPAFCRAQGMITPSSDSHIEFEVWLPTSGWNGKYQGVGNGGTAGEISYEYVAAALGAGYAVSATDTGHEATGVVDAQWALGHPEKVIDYGHRAIHETAEKAKAIIRAFYGKPPTRSYFSGCSTGGRQALMEAQRYPADYDGLIAGAPAANLTRIIALFSANTLALARDPSAFIPPTKYVAIEAATLAACDASDGLNDGLIAEPTRCHFDPASLLCRSAESDTCLTVPQVETLKRLYAGLRAPNADPLYPGFMPGGESGSAGWALWLSGQTPERNLEYLWATQIAGSLLLQNPFYNWRTFSVDRDLRAAEKVAGRALNATDPDLRAFEKRGGKLILYHGWSDAGLPPLGTVEYYRSVIARLGQQRVDGFVRTYMVPGMQHCGGGPGADNFGMMPGLLPVERDPARNMSAALEEWVEHGTRPSSIIATKYATASSEIMFTRPLCPYPTVTRYKGAGRTDDAKNFVCATP